MPSSIPLRILLAASSLLAILMGIVCWRDRRPQPDAGATRGWRARANRALDLGHAGKTAAVDELLPLSRDAMKPVRDNALWGLHRLTGAAWGLHPEETEAWWRNRPAGGAQTPPADLVMRERNPAPDPPFTFGLEPGTPEEVILDDRQGSLTARWTVTYSGSTPVEIRGAPRDAYWAYRCLADGGSILDAESVLPYAWVMLVVRGVRFGADARPQEIGAEAGISLDRTRFAPRSSFGELVGFPLPGAGDENAGFAALEVHLRVEPFFISGFAWQPRAPPPFFTVLRPAWRPETPHLSPSERVQTTTGAAKAGLAPRCLSIFRLAADASAAAPPGKRDGSEVAKAYRGRLSGTRRPLRPWLYVSGIGWVLLEDPPTEPASGAPLVPTLTLEAALPGERADRFAWGVEFE